VSAGAVAPLAILADHASVLLRATFLLAVLASADLGCRGEQGKAEQCHRFVEALEAASVMARATYRSDRSLSQQVTAGVPRLEKERQYIAGVELTDGPLRAMQGRYLAILDRMLFGLRLSVALLDAGPHADLAPQTAAVKDMQAALADEWALVADIRAYCPAEKVPTPAPSGTVRF
jgi:hypothetical protein